MCGRHTEAKAQYTVLLDEPHLPTQLKADIYRQMGWMHHSVEAFGEKNARIENEAIFGESFLPNADNVPKFIRA